MDSTELILTGNVAPPELLGPLTGRSIAKAQADEIQNLSRQEQEKAAKDFESVLLGRLLDEMKNTIGDWGFEKDGASQQIQGIFWLYLAQDIADKGGTGLWKDIYESLAGSNNKNTTPGLNRQHSD